MENHIQQNKNSEHTSETCIFCKIIKGEISCKKVYEDETVLAFLDINGITEGHTLVIPKEHYTNIFDIPEESLSNIIKVVKKLSVLYKEKLGCDGINVVNANDKSAHQSVFHYHMHIIPRKENDGIDLDFHGVSRTNEELDKVLEKIKN
jgi:histidine triad (HIT) family protein